MNEFSRKLQLLAWVAYLTALPASWAWLPEMVGDDGKQATKVAYVSVMLITALPLPWAMCGGLLKWLRRHPSQLNLPHKDYWLAPERADATWVRLDALMLRLGWMIWSLLALIHYRAVAERPGVPDVPGGPGDQAVLPSLPESAFEITMFALVVLVLADALRSTLAWRVPKARLEAFHAQPTHDSAKAAGHRAIRRPPRPGQPSRRSDHGELR